LHSVEGRYETLLSGRYVRMFDHCGPVRAAGSCSDLDLGTSAGTDCSVPPGAAPGNTRSSRSGFYEVNRIVAQAKGYRPTNAWLAEQLTANMNINNSCNAFWNGSTINFYREGGGCRNTGEIAAVFDHEWGHGMDNNDNIPEVSFPGEAYADIAAMYRLDTSCVGRGFIIGGNCGGNGDPCLECSGVREDDWTKRRSGKPHDIDWVLEADQDPPGGCNYLTPSPNPPVPPPIPGVNSGPCNFGTHCEGTIVGEAFWDLYRRDLQGYQGSAIDLDGASALELATKLFYTASDNVNYWYQCIGRDSGLGGCNPDGGYLNLLAADDDNGNLADGTPHMSAIFAAFDRHQLACIAPAVVNAGCAAGPQAAPAVTAAASPLAARLSWSPVPNAAEYWVYRTEGVFGFEFGKELVAKTADTFFADGGLNPSMTYHYGVVAVGAGGCFGPMSSGAAVVPEDDDGPAAPALDVQFASASAEGGDGDEFVDNCETANVAVRITNAGNRPLTNVRVVAVEPLSHPDTEVVTALPKLAAASLSDDCAVAASSTLTPLQVRPQGVGPGETLELRVRVTADEIAPATVDEIVRVESLETDWTAVASRTYSFENDSEGWQTVQGTFARQFVGDGSDGSQYMASSAGLSDQCDQVRSPEIRLTGSTALSLYNQFTTEPYNQGSWYDRANVGLVDAETGVRHRVDPDGGRLYTAEGPHGFCVTEGQPGWSTDAEGDSGVGWQPTSFSAAALAVPSLAGKRAFVDIVYGTDAYVSGTGFWFDQVTLTDFEERGSDAQGDACRSCSSLDDDDAAVEYAGGWTYVRDQDASSGGYHRRKGNNSAGVTPAARLVFTGDEVTVVLGRFKHGGHAEIFVDGVSREQVSLWAEGSQPSFDLRRTYGGLGNGQHEIRVVHRAGVVIVDGFEFCAVYSGANAAAVTRTAETSTTTAATSDGPVILRTVTATKATELITVEVEGAAVPLGVKLVDSLGRTVASASQPLVPGLADTGLDFKVPAAGVYTVQVLNTLAPGGTLTIHTVTTQKK
jgi:hypothetical protein